MTKKVKYPTTVWSKYVPGHKLKVLGPPDSLGNIPVHGIPFGVEEDTEPSYGVVPEAEFSYEELAPIPEDIPNPLYMVVYGKGSEWEADVYPTEREARRGIAATPDAIGYVPVTFTPNGMISVS